MPGELAFTAFESRAKQKRKCGKDSICELGELAYHRRSLVFVPIAFFLRIYFGRSHTANS